MIARSSTERYAREVVDVRTVGRQIGARYVLDGSVRQAGTQLRVVVQLTDTEKQSAAQACRIAAYQAEQDAAKQSNPTVRATFEATARRYLDLAAKLAAGKSRDSR